MAATDEPEPFRVLAPLPPARADACLRAARESLSWRCERVRLFGREIPQPRLTAFEGAPGTVYRYGGLEHRGEGWPSWLDTLLAWLAEAERLGPARRTRTGAVPTGAGTPAPNCMLANRYRDGADCVGWHSDDERDLCAGSRIVTVSLGACRPVRFRRRGAKASEPGARPLLEPAHGSVYVMSLASQRHWQHSVPRTRRPVGERISLTFRRTRVDGA